MVGNAVSVPMAKWIAERLTAKVDAFDDPDAAPLPAEGSWPSAAWCHGGERGKSDASNGRSPRRRPTSLLSSKHRTTPLSKKAAGGSCRVS
jgi:DNA (cytosine-5)-methyltransferase 1